ncbi:inositol 1,4,5-trisphosphate receptor-interacting protein [Ictalurus punctatus]|uniref:Inositol 1,4,5-trisphosphate receptor-interacting protein n=1 Tax=Ictalurus punctatus TaxID=7998 RepID=A0A2D0Q3K9_ICTPU|nr:inositol 1,4,5-trisphosphate receptor-interacting protein [Ictalurus punctatus]
MEEMLLRVCVVVVSLLYIKDHTVFQEQEENIIMDMQEREYLLQKESAKLEQEVHQVTTGLPHSNQEVSQSHQRMTNGEGEDSDVQQGLANVKVQNPHEHQMPRREDQDILHQNLLIKDIQDEAVPRTHDNVPSALHDGAIVDDNFTSEKGIQPEIVRDSQNEIKNFQEDDMLEHKKEVPHNDQKMKTLSEDQIKEVQGKSPLNGLQDSDEKSSHLDQMGERNHEENPTTSRQQSTENPYNWYLWKFLFLISLIRLLRKFISKNSQSSGTIIPIKDKTTSPGILSKICIPDHQVLSCFYDQCVQVPPRTSGRLCDFVEGFVDELLEAAREASSEETDMQIGDFIGVGSLYELWATGKTMVCDLYVPITAPRSHGFDVELWKENDASLLRFGRIKMVKAENTSNGCPCMDENSNNEDVLCLLHPHSETSKVMINAVGGPLCQENTPYLSKKQVVTWFRTVIMNGWKEISHKYEFELGFRNQMAPGALRVRFRSGQIVLFNITPVVQVKASKVYLVSYLSTNQNISDIHWPISFARYENALFQYFNRILPYNSCHIECLQILSFLHKQQNSLTGKCGLTSHHLKSALLHLLMCKPTEWKHEQLTGRLNDMLTFLEQRLEAKVFHHALVGNSLVPKDIGLPKEFQMAKPTNIFLPMVLNEECYLKTVHHFQELVKNAPVLFQEYGSMKSSGLQKK